MITSFIEAIASLISLTKTRGASVLDIAACLTGRRSVSVELGTEEAVVMNLRVRLLALDGGFGGNRWSVMRPTLELRPVANVR